MFQAHHEPDFYCGCKDLTIPLEDPEDGAMILQPIVLKPNGQPLSIAPSLALMHRSPTGFNWGNEGRGANQLAFVILYDHTDDELRSLEHYRDLLHRYVARWDNNWALSKTDLEGWLIDRERR